jgi:hypothetical protein
VAAASYILATGLGPVDAAIIGVCAWRSASWPDAMEPEGSIGGSDKIGFIGRALRSRFPGYYKHRGWTHWLITGFLVALVPALFLRHVDPRLAADVFRGLCIGIWHGHLFADGSTIHGDPLFGPFDRTPKKVSANGKKRSGGNVRNRHLMPKGYRFNTNGVSDTVLRWGIVLVVVACTYLTAKNVVSPHLDGRGLTGLFVRQN